MKSSRATLTRDVAIPGPYLSFFSFPVSKGGYSGVAVYVDSRKVIPLKAEEGLSGKLQPKPPSSAEERISRSYSSPHDIDLYADEDGDVLPSFDALDGEGRGLVIDFGLFVLVNVYCPNETSDARLSFKMNYHLMLQERVRKLVEEEHREVIVLGDINICATPLDHCDGHLPSNQATFYHHPARAWFKKWLSPNGPMIDVVREHHPNRKGLFTCWNMKIQARETNYGTRVDYILVTKGLLPWIAHGDIQPSLKGSDHCPIYVDLREEITSASGDTISLRDAMKQSEELKEPPRIAAKFWDEFSGKQTVLSAFFGKPAAAQPASHRSSPPTVASTSTAPAPTGRDTMQDVNTPLLPQSIPPSQPDPEATPPKESKKLKPSGTRPAPSMAASQKRKAAESSSASASKKRKRPDKGQASLASFFSKPATSTSASSASTSARPREVIEIDDDPPPTSPVDHCDDTDQLNADYRLACALAAAEGEPPSSPLPSQSQSQSQNKDKDKAAWSNLFAPIAPPRCTVHDEPARLYTVNKQGPNKGKTFYLCSRPVGPGYDKGKGERLRDEVDHRYRCNYFKWASEVRRDAIRERDRERTKSGSLGVGAGEGT